MKNRPFPAPGDAYIELMSLFDPTVATLMGRLALAPELVRKVACWRSVDSTQVGDHLHCIPTVYLCLAGTARVVGGPQGRIDLAAGDALVIAPGVRHAHAPVRRGSVTIDVGFLAQWCDFDLGDHATHVWGRVPQQPYAEVCRRMVVAPADERVQLTRRLFTELKDERIEAMGFPHPGVRPMAYRLWANPPGLTAAHILAVSGLQPRRAHAVFLDFFGTSPKQAILAQRLALAASFLADGASIAAAAERAGFLRRADLTRAWTLAHGTPPRQAAFKQ